jgi:hypothetical protein
MSNYEFYYPNRFRAKTKNFDNIFNEWKSVENSWGSGPKQDQVIIKYFGNELSNEIRNSKMFSFLGYRRFDKSGSNIFHFKKELLGLLEKTDVSDLQICNIKFPFNNFYLSLRELNKPFSSNPDDDTIIDGVYINFHDDSKDEVDYHYWISFHLCGFSESKKEIEFKYNVVDKMELASDLSFERSTSKITDAIKLVHQIMSDTLDSKTMTQNDIDTEINYQLEHYKNLKDNLNLFINCILYVSSDKPDIETKYVDGLPSHLKSKFEKANTKHRKYLVEKEIKRFGYSKINLAGKSFSNHQLIQQVKTEMSSHWRRGHWRNQLFGKDLNESKIIWIKPTIVNKEKGEPNKGHIYLTE